MRWFSNRRGQSGVELSLLFVAVVAALLGLAMYVRFAVQGRLHQARLTLLRGGTPFYEETGAVTRDFTLAIREEVSSTPFAPVTVVNPLRGINETQVRINTTATTTFTETTSRSQ